MNTNMYSITDLRHHTKTLLNEVKEVGFVYVVKNSKPTAALVDINYLNALQDAYEDFLDDLEFDQARSESGRTIPLTQHLKSYATKHQRHPSHAQSR